MSELDEIRERHKSVRGYPMALHPDDGHTYTAVVDEFCETCHSAQPCDVSRVLAIATAPTDALEAAWADAEAALGEWWLRALIAVEAGEASR